MDAASLSGVRRPMDVANHSAARLDAARPLAPARQDVDCLGTAHPPDAAPHQAASRFDALEPLPPVEG